MERRQIDISTAMTPFRGYKMNVLEGGIHIPFAVQWPARLPSPLVYQKPVSSLDIVPTAAAAAGVSLPTDRIYDGLNMIPYFAGEQVGPDRTLFWRWADLGSDGPPGSGDTIWAVRSGTLKLVTGSGYDGPTASSLRSLQRYRRVAGFGPHSARRRGRPPAAICAMEYADNFYYLATRIRPRATTTRIGRGLECVQYIGLTFTMAPDENYGACDTPNRHPRCLQLVHKHNPCRRHWRGHHPRPSFLRPCGGQKIFDPMGRRNNKHRWHDFSSVFCRNRVGTHKQHYFRKRLLLLVPSSRVGGTNRLQHEPRSIQNLCATNLGEREWANATDADG